MSELFSGINKTFAAVFGAVYPDAVYHEEVEVKSATADPSITTVDHNCKAQIDDSMTGTRGDGSTVTNKRHVLILTSTLSIVPKPNDAITITPTEGGAEETLTIVEVAERDPVNSYYRCEVKT